MPDFRIRRALVAVYDKTGIVEFARALVDEFGIEIISTGGTAKHLKQHGIAVTLVETITGFPEMLDGRVKTLHPKIHAAILADRDNPDHMRQLAEQGIEPIDLVVVNLYPFEKTVADPNCTREEAIEMIDIGGPCLLRAAAKNHRHVWTICEPRLCNEFLAIMREKESESPFTDDGMAGARRTFAGAAYRMTCEYDRNIQAYFVRTLARETPTDFGQPGSLLPSVSSRVTKLVSELRYGENPHQPAGVYAALQPRRGLLRESALQGEMSFNNYLDADAALGLCAELTRETLQEPPRPEVPVCSEEPPSGRGSSFSASAAGDSTAARPEGRGASFPAIAVFVKHTNPSGVGIADDPGEAYRRAYLGDPNAAMGGILAVNFVIDASFAEVVMETLDRWGKNAGAGAFFIEVWLAPSFDEAAVEAIRSRKKWGENVRLLAVGELSRKPDPNELVFRSISGGMLVQTPDLLGLNEDSWKVVTRRPPTESELSDLRLAWLIAKHTKSNAISIVKDGMLLGNGAGQMSRVMSCRIATWLAKDNGHASRLAGSAAASDAFFPFRDGPDQLLDAGVTAVIQPGGSKRDAETIAACDERGAAMIFTGTRHFKH